MVRVYYELLFSSLIILFRPVAIENKFTKISYFFAWSGFRSPAANKNVSALYNNEHVVNRGEIRSSNQ
jgi:hypothetical protein